MNNSQQFQEQIVALTRAFGWHRPMSTPCGKPVTIAEAHTLLALSQCAPLTQKELGKQLRLAKSTVSRVVAKLISRQWLEKNVHPVDKRATSLFLTALGIEKAQELADARQAKLEGIWGKLSAKQQTRLTIALNDLMEAIDAQT